MARFASILIPDAAMEWKWNTNSVYPPPSQTDSLAKPQEVQ